MLLPFVSLFALATRVTAYMAGAEPSTDPAFADSKPHSILTVVAGSGYLLQWPVLKLATKSHSTTDEANNENILINYSEVPSHGPFTTSNNANWVALMSCEVVVPDGLNPISAYEGGARNILLYSATGAPCQMTQEWLDDQASGFLTNIYTFFDANGPRLTQSAVELNSDVDFRNFDLYTWRNPTSGDRVTRAFFADGGSDRLSMSVFSVLSTESARPAPTSLVTHDLPSSAIAASGSTPATLVSASQSSPAVSDSVSRSPPGMSIATQSTPSRALSSLASAPSSAPASSSAFHASLRSRLLLVMASSVLLVFHAL